MVELCTRTPLNSTPRLFSMNPRDENTALAPGRRLLVRPVTYRSAVDAVSAPRAWMTSCVTTSTDAGVSRRVSPRRDEAEGVSERSAETRRSSAKLETDSRTSIDVVVAASIVRSARLSANPACDTRITTVPLLRSSTVNRPARSVLATTDCPSCGLTMTDASGIGAPDGSSTVPDSVWARAGWTVTNSNTRTHMQRRIPESVRDQLTEPTRIQRTVTPGR